jgi:peroxiredoxin Q/BCP
MNKRIVFSALPVLLALITGFTTIEKGDRVPDFTAVDENGKPWKLSDHRAAYLVVYFYPAAFTGGCTSQACSYRDYNEAYSKLNAKIVGISGDEHQNLASFKEHHGLNFTLLSDPDGRIAELFGVPTRDGGSIEKAIGGQELVLNRGVTTSRWTFVMDVNGKLIYKAENVSASTDPETVLDFIKTHDSRKSCMPRG